MSMFPKCEEKKIVILEKKITVVRYLKFADERKSSRKISECPVFQTSFFSEAITQYEKTYLLTDKLTKKGLSYLPSHSHTKNIFVRDRSRFEFQVGHSNQSTLRSIKRLVLLLSSL